MSIDTLWFTRCPAPTAASIAIRRGWLHAEFAPDGIAVRSLAESGDKAVHLSHYDHSQANSFRFGGYVPPLIARSRGQDIRIVGLGLTDRAAGVFALAGSDIETARDLRGRRLGVPRRLNDGIDWWRATVLAGYHRALQLAGLSLDDVDLVEIPVAREYVSDATPGAAAEQSLWGARSQFAVQREEIETLIRGGVDAIYSEAALQALLLAFLGLRPVAVLDGRVEPGPHHHPYVTVLTVSGGLLRERPDLVRRWLGRLLEAKAWAAANAAEAHRIVARDTGLPEDLVPAAYSARVHAQLDVTLDPARIANLVHRHDRLREHGLIAVPIDFDAFIDPAPLHEAEALLRDGGSGAAASAAPAAIAAVHPVAAGAA